MTFKQAHKCLSLLVFVQLFIWLGSGFLLGKVDATKAAGRDTLVAQTPGSFAYLYKPTDTLNSPTNKSLVPLATLIRDYPLASQITLSHLLNHPVYQLKIAAGQHAYELSDYTLVDAVSAERIDLTDPSMTAEITALIYALAYQSHTDYSSSVAARLSYRESLLENKSTRVNVKHSAKLLYPPIDDLPRERNAVWQVNIADSRQTSIYIRAQTGHVIAHVNDETRWRNLLLLLHFMDYPQEGNFNNWLIKIFAVLTLLLSGTGLWWLGRLFKDGQIKLTWFIRKKTVVIRTNKSGQTFTATASANASILNALVANKITIQSACGGGGVCGTCIFKVKVELPITFADSERFTPRELALGYRLACQHLLKEVTEIALDR